MAKNRAPEIFSEAPDSRLENHPEVAETCQDTLPPVPENASGQYLWSKFDPEGLMDQALADALTDAGQGDYVQTVQQAQKQFKEDVATIKSTTDAVVQLNPVQNAITAVTGKSTFGDDVSKTDRGLAILGTVAGPSEKVLGEVVKEAKAAVTVLKSKAAAKVEDTAKAVSDTSKTGVTKAGHEAKLTVLNSEGEVIHSETLVSGGTGKRKPTFPEQGAVHTEGIGTRKVEKLIEDGADVGGVVYEGRLEPCKMCKGKMNKLHRETGVPSTYIDESKTPWESSPGRRPPASQQ